MKSCLKVSSLPGSPDPSNGNGGCRKCVAFNAEGSEEVHWADEWDRTPTEFVKKLSYQELLELKEIQQSLPHAPQPADPLRPGKQLLSMVPIGLLPLASAETSSASPVSPPPQSPGFALAAPTPTFVMPPGRARGAPTPPRMASASLTHLRPPVPPPPRIKPAFAFLPLLASPSPPPTSTSNAPSNPTSNATKAKANGAMNDASYFPQCEYPPARSAADGEPDRVLPTFSSASRPRPIPISGTAHQQPHPVGGYEHAYRAAEAAAYSPPFGSSLYDYKRDRHAMLGDRDRVAGPSTGASSGVSATTVVKGAGKKKKKTVMFINDEVVEIEEDDDEDEEEEVSGPPSLTLPPPAKEEPPIKMEPKPSEPPIPSALSLSALAISASPPSQTSPRLAVGTGARPASPLNARPSSPLTPLAPLTTAGAGRLSPVQARASSRLVRV